MHFIQPKQFSELNATSHIFQQISDLNIFPERYWKRCDEQQAARGPVVSPNCSRLNRDLVDDETNVYVDVVFRKWKNLKPLDLDAYWTANNLPEEQRNSRPISKLRKLQ